MIKNEELKNLITKRNYKCKYLSKIKFQVYNNHRSQGIIIDFDGDVVLKNLPDLQLGLHISP